LKGGLSIQEQGRRICKDFPITTKLPSRASPGYPPAMNKTDITPDQAKQLADAVCRQKAYLYGLRDRMEKRGFKASDPLYQKGCVRLRCRVSAVG
jgi:hypothetical protein